MGSRHILALLGFWGFAMAYAMRFNLAIAIVAMSKSNKIQHLGSSSVNEDTITDFSLMDSSTSSAAAAAGECQEDSGATLAEKNVSMVDQGEFDWDEQDQGIIMSSFFWGYVIMIIK
jgi:ACS family sodium-dependent inorganic phosphate cotransporter